MQKHSYPISDHYDGKLFKNPDGRGVKNFYDIIKWGFEGGRKKWPKYVNHMIAPRLPSQLKPHEIAITFVNHATLYTQSAEFSFITDPVFSKRVSPFTTIGPERHHDPGLIIEQLPQLDLVIISHNHYDHMDIEALKKIKAKFDPLFITPLANAHLLKEANIHKVVELDWWESYTMQNSLITLAPAQHWSGRGTRDRLKSLWGSFMVRAQNKNIYFAGDTGYGPHFSEIQKRIGPPDVAFLPIGAYEPRWFMRDQHMNPDDSVLAHKDIGSRLSIAMHFGCFQLTNEGIDDPITDLNIALDKYEVPSKDFVVLKPGETVLR